MTGAEIMAVVGFFLTLSAAGWAVWWRIEGKVKEARTESTAAASAAQAMAALARDELGEFKLKAAETYATKAGMEAQTAQIMRAIEGVGNRIDGLNERLDRIYESRPRTSRRTAGD